MLSVEQYAGRILAMTEQDLRCELKKMYAAFYLNRPHTFSKSLANRNLQLLFAECVSRGRVDIYREVGDSIQSKRHRRDSGKTFRIITTLPTLIQSIATFETLQPQTLSI